MLQELIHAAYDSGAEVVIFLNNNNDVELRGTIQDMDDRHLALFHSGHECGYRWVIRTTDIAACGMVTRLAGATSSSGQADTLQGLDTPDSSLS